MNTESLVSASATSTPEVSTLKFISIPELKAMLNVATIDIVKSPTTGKLFAATPNGNFKVQASIDFGKALRFMYSEDISTGCVVNVVENTVAVI